MIDQRMRIGFWATWAVISVGVALVVGPLSPFIAIGSAYSIPGIRPSEAQYYAISVLQAGILALPAGLLAAFILGRRFPETSRNAKILIVSAFVAAGVLVAAVLLLIIASGFTAAAVLGSIVSGSFSPSIYLLAIPLCGLAFLLWGLVLVGLLYIPFLLKSRASSARKGPPARLIP